MAFSRLFQSCRKCFFSETDILKEKNHANPKVKSLLISHESGVIFEKAWKLLQEVSFDSKAADVIIAGAAIWAMACEDGKYYDWHHRNTQETSSMWRLRETRYYPHKRIDEIAKICNITLQGMLHDDDIGNNIITIGTRAINDKDLGFEGNISAFTANAFQDSDWSEWTDRFDKYDLTASEQAVKLKPL